MTNHNQLASRVNRGRRRGAMLVMFAVCLPIFLIMVVFAVDIA